MSAAGEPAEFRLDGPLPEGVTILEASAGTGKTYTIAALAARFVAEGTPLERMLLITFTRMATGELRDRVRERLVRCETRLGRLLAGAPDDGGDEVVSILARGSRAEVELRHRNLARAVSDFDAATIATTHGFCQEVLAELGTTGDLDSDTVFVEDTSALLEEVLDDLYVRRFASRDTPSFGRREALKIAEAAVGNAGAELAPPGDPPGSAAAMRVRLAGAVREEIERRKRRLSVMTYDDLLTRLERTLSAPSGEAARERLRRRFSVVLVDEFQDTDPIQWSILRRAFAAPGVSLVLIADPKQAIYAFRGADVYAYLDAARAAGTLATLRVNRRSDQGLLDGLDALFAGARLGHEDIAYREVRSTRAHRSARLRGDPRPVPLRVRIVPRDTPGLRRVAGGCIQVDSARSFVARDLAGQVVAELDAGRVIETRAPDGRVQGQEPVCPGHLAVLVRTNGTAALVRDELAAAGVPVVINGAESVFATAAAEDWLALLEALELPGSATRARAVALGAFLGWSAERVATAAPEELDGVHRRLHGWARVLRENGIAALAGTVWSGERLAERMLAVEGGERQLTDLRQLAQLLHRAASAERLGVTALRGWLAERVEDSGRGESEQERTRRLESDAQAVQVLTIHRSKGLEFPIVLCPFLWDPSRVRDREPVTFHDPADGLRYKLDVGLAGARWEEHVGRHRVEQRGEDLRLAYVALTRARHAAIVWWAGSKDAGDSPLGRLLFARDGAGNVAPFGGGTPSDAAVRERLLSLGQARPGCLGVELARPGGVTSWGRMDAPPEALQAAAFARRLDLRWRRTSYSALTASAHEASVGSEPEAPALDDEPEVVVPAPGAVTAAAAGSAPAAAPAAGGSAAVSLPFAALPAGTEFGTLVHRVLEGADFAAADLAAELRARIAEQPSRGLAGADPEALVTALNAALATPLGPLADGLRLLDVPRHDRLDELAFELPLAGGETPSGDLSPADIAQVLDAYLPPGDPLAGYAARLRDPLLGEAVRGFLTGSIDLVVRLPGPRFLLADYKTNWLGPPDEPLSLRAYGPAALGAEMRRAHYGLQALLYTVALHRFLRWRVSGYDPGRHLGGVLYLFLRGMVGPGEGVFDWAPPAELVVAMSDLLDRGAS